MDNAKEFILSIKSNIEDDEFYMSVSSGDPSLADMLAVVMSIIYNGEQKSPGYKQTALKLISAIEEGNNVNNR